MIYKFKPGSHLRGDPQAIGERLTDLEEEGRLTPVSVVEDARREDSPLHPYFEWDDSKAAEAHRLTQAGHLIRSVTVVFDRPETDDTEDEPKVIRAFVPVSDENEDRRYVTTVRALGDEEMRKQVLRQAHSELGAVARKYRELKELSDVVGAIDRVGELLKESEGQHA